MGARIKRAPNWMQRAGLEWLRLVLQELGQMSRRYLVANLVFAVLAAVEFSRTLLDRPDCAGADVS
jgi:N-acetylglucosaminyldiphosphoundecaprenol N-acetyl-beta-D-mannosaminyltransferase